MLLSIKSSVADAGGLSPTVQSKLLFKILGRRLTVRAHSHVGHDGLAEFRVGYTDNCHTRAISEILSTILVILGPLTQDRSFSVVRRQTATLVPRMSRASATV
jgi:hypothetical protein